ncbi:GPO family capsid scaffolding protein [Lysobacter gummosus]|uniref:GPO family capsid scaffolding protein n=1 Tax=Lysobacter gummosus TaxID=262324 RepID=A0ABY3X682_9GAMM|nr:GPO family capsid scaffolding protein [Lysobacter gummosus]UNP28081.1 GPO family capsid scaffolding protein [Lysobacter gummosus]
MLRAIAGIDHNPIETTLVRGSLVAKQVKFYRVAVEGNTCDRRVIERSWLLDAAATYNRETYAARVWMEHIRSVSPESPFGAYGDVLALKTEMVEINGERKLALFAQIQPTTSLVALNKKKQKLYSSIEIEPDFASTGRAYLTGLAVTDSPASLGTEMLTFAATNPGGHPYASRKFSANSVFTVAEPIEFAFDEEAEQPAAPGETLFNKVRSLLGIKSRTDDARFADVHSAVEQIAQATADASTAIGERNRDAQALRQEFDCYRSDTERELKAFRELLDVTPNGEPTRPTATGADADAFTDC